MMKFSPDWEYVADTVMGGVSTGRIDTSEIDGMLATRLTGTVSLDNNGGFVQMAFDVLEGKALDVSEYTGIAITLRGNGETYDVRLRTDQLTRPWQSFRAEVNATDLWTKVYLPFAKFASHRTEAQFDPKGLRRIGILAIGRAFTADVVVSEIGLYSKN